MNLKKYVDQEEASGKNPLAQAGSDRDLTMTNDEKFMLQFRTHDNFEKDLSEMKKAAGTAGRCAAIAVYSDDSAMDAEKKLANLLWKVVRLYFTTGSP